MIGAICVKRVGQKRSECCGDGLYAGLQRVGQKRSECCGDGLSLYSEELSLFLSFILAKIKCQIALSEFDCICSIQREDSVEQGVTKLSGLQLFLLQVKFLQVELLYSLAAVAIVTFCKFDFRNIHTLVIITS